MRNGIRGIVSGWTVLTVALLAPAVWAEDGHGVIVGWGDQVIGVDLSHGVVAVAAGAEHCLGLKADDSIVAWGSNGYGQCNQPLPTATTTYMAIAAGTSHSLALMSDGSLVAWGLNYSGQCDIPSPNTDFVGVAGGGAHSLGLKADGSIVTWGDNYWGQCNVPEPNTGFVAVTAGATHSLGLKGYPLVGDADCDGDVDSDDLIALLQHYGVTSGATWGDGDCDADGDVDLADLAALLANYGVGG